MGLLDRLFGDSEEGASTTIIRDDDGRTISRDRSVQDVGNERTKGTTTRTFLNDGSENRTTRRGGSIGTDQQGTTNQQQTRRGQEHGTTNQRGRDDRTSSRTGQRQDTGALERLLDTFRTSDTTTGQRGSNLVDSLMRSGTVVENLDQASRDSLASLLQEFSGEDGGLSEFVNLLETRVGTSQRQIAQQNADILKAAEAQGTRDIAQTQSRLASAAGGSTQNSLVQATAAELRNDLQLNLAGLEAQLNQQARAEEREEIDQVLRGFGVQGTVAQQVGSTLARGRQEATGFERGHETLQSLVDSITSSREDTRARENALNTLTSMTQEQLLETVQSARRQDAQRTTDNVLFGETTQQQQTLENQFLTDLIHSVTGGTRQEVTDHDIVQIIDKISRERSDEAQLGERRGVHTTDSERESSFNLRDVFDWVSDLGSRAAG